MVHKALPPYGDFFHPVDLHLWKDSVPPTWQIKVFNVCALLHTSAYCGVAFYLRRGVLTKWTSQVTFSV